MSNLFSRLILYAFTFTLKMGIMTMNAPRFSRSGRSFERTLEKEKDIVRPVDTSYYIFPSIFFQAFSHVFNFLHEVRYV